MPHPPPPPPQRYLEENELLIRAIVENQGQGRIAECVQYQEKLQANLSYLAYLADLQLGQMQGARGEGG